MATPEVKVKITGDQSGLDSGLTGASRGIQGFASSAITALKGLAATAAALAVGKFLKDAVDEAINAEQGMRRLGIAVTNAGESFPALRDRIESTVDEVRRLSTFTDDDLRAALTNLILKSGDVQGSLKNLGLVADIASDGQHDLASASDLVGKAMGGTVTGFNKIGIAGKDANTVLAGAREAFRGLAEGEAATLGGRLKNLGNAWDEMKEAVGNAIVNSGAMQTVTSALVTQIERLAVWIEENEGAIGEFSVRVGEAVVAVGTWVRENTAALASLVKLAGGIVEMSGKVTAFFAKVLAFADRNLIGEALGLTQKGVDETKQRAQVLQGVVITAAKTTETESAASGKRLTRAQIEEAEAREKELEKRRKEARAAQEKAEKEFEERVAKARADSAKVTIALIREVGERFQDGVRLTKARVDELARAVDEALGETAAEAVRSTQKELQIMQVQLQKMTTDNRLSKEEQEKAAAALKKASDELARYNTLLLESLPTQSAMKGIAEDAAKANERIAGAVDKQKALYAEIIPRVADIARSALDFGQAMGLVDRNSAAVLNSIINIGASIARLGIDPVGGIIGIIGGLANVISGIGSSAADKERRALLAKNNIELAKLAAEIGNFALGATGRTVAGAQSVFGGLEGRIADLSKNFLTRKAEAPQLKADILKGLRAKGVSLSDFLALLDEIAPELRKGFESTDANTLATVLPRILKALQTTEFGQRNKEDFAEQLKALESAFDVFGVTDPAEKLKGFKALLGKFSPLLAGALSAGSVEEQIVALQNLFTRFQKGGLNAADFGGLSASETESVLKTLIGLLRTAPSAGGGTLPDDMFGKALGASFAPGLGTVGTALGIGGPGSPPTGATDGLVTPTAIGTQIGTQVAGDLVFNITEAADPRATAREVAVILGEKYALQLVALGRPV